MIKRYKEEEKGKKVKEGEESEDNYDNCKKKKEKYRDLVVLLPLSIGGCLLLDKPGMVI